jgi:AhpD family alkylhydroperoxidase
MMVQKPHKLENFRMPTVNPPKNLEADPRVKAVYDDIRAVRKSEFITNVWRYLAFDPGLLEETWGEVKAVMATPSELDPLTKELIYVAVSVANGCEYCVHSHTAAAKAKGMSQAQHAELIRIIALAGKTNQIATALQLPVDPEFDADR